MIDTHSHIYSEEFDADIAETIQRAKDAGIEKIILPNCDSGTMPRMLALEAQYPTYCFAAIGLHPTSVNENYQSELDIVKSELERRKYIAIGETGIDLYWDKTFLAEQIHAFRQQIEWALQYNLPLIVHVRDAFPEALEVLSSYKNSGLKGVFHSFTGTIEDAMSIINFGGFKFGINGIVTFKNSGLAEVISKIDLQHLILETDSPYLSPIPHRGKRNESAYTSLICQKIAEVHNTSAQRIDKITTENAKSLFTI